MIVTNSTHIRRDGKFAVGGQTVGAFADMEGIYENLGMDYPKFFKMDRMSQLALVLAEPLFGKDRLSADSGLVIQNRHSSYEPDVAHLNNVINKISGPANFTYTLPNIALGELAIRHQLNGEMAVFIASSPDFDQLQRAAQVTAKDDQLSEIVVGWLDVGPEGYEGFLARIDCRTPSVVALSTQLQKLYEFLIL